MILLAGYFRTQNLTLIKES